MCMDWKQLWDRDHDHCIPALRVGNAVPSLHDRLYRKIFHCLLPLVKWTTFRSITQHNREDTVSIQYYTVIM